MISVIIPTYNRARLLPRALESVLGQTWRDLEVLVVDDGSEDDTRQAVEAIGDPRVRYIRHPQRRGACAARNTGIENARGAYIAFQDSDDVWLPDKLTVQMRRLEESGADVVCCAFERYDPHGNFLFVTPPPEIAPGRVDYEQLLFQNFISTQTLLGKAECFRRFRFDESMPRLQDWELMLRMCRQCDVRYFDDMLVRLYEQGDSITGRPELGIAALDRIYELHREAIDSSDRIMVQMLLNRESFSYACGKASWPVYLKALSPKHGLRTNLYLLLRAVRSTRVYFKPRA